MKWLRMLLLGGLVSLWGLGGCVVDAVTLQTSKEVTLYVGPEWAACPDDPDGQCLQIREDPAEEWRVLPGPIEGFDYVAGQQYQLDVVKEVVMTLRVSDQGAVQLPPDRTDIRYRLLAIAGQEKVEPPVVTTAGTTTTAGDDAGAPGAETAGRSAGLAESRWTLRRYGPPGSERPVLAYAAVTLEFLPQEGEPAQGRMRGRTGCNLFGGVYSLAGERPELVVQKLTRQACPGEAAREQEQRFLAALEDATALEVAPGQLRILYDGGRQVLTFVPMP